MTVEEQLAALRRANEEEGWGIGDSVFARLSADAPGWPEGEMSYRSLRIRFGEGKEGVARTFKAHCKRLERILNRDHTQARLGHGQRPAFDVLDMNEVVKRVRLWPGNQNHKSCVEWVVIRLVTYDGWPIMRGWRGRGKVDPADEVLVLGWLLPSVLRGNGYHGIAIPGYAVDYSDELDYDSGKERGWDEYFHLSDGGLYALAADHGYSGNAYPLLKK
ncbi:MAG: hypothetical protein PHC53_02470 [Patescibacteria group bacterium]|nr:hypothetical protein [Patescibacteria group bacterium]